MNIPRSRLLLLLPLASTFTACSNGGPVDIGQNSGGAALSDYAATWDGYVEAYQFDDGSDRIRLILDATGDGTLEVGDTPPRPPLTDPSILYPGVQFSYRSQLYPGVRYPVHGTRIESKRIKLGVNTGEYFEGWCAAQIPIANEGYPDQSSCIHTGRWSSFSDGVNCTQTNTATGEVVTVDCLRLVLCEGGNPCQCTSAGCTTNWVDGSDAAPYPDQIDAALGSIQTELTGTLLGDYGRVNVRMQRQ